MFYVMYASEKEVEVKEGLQGNEKMERCEICATSVEFALVAE